MNKGTHLTLMIGPVVPLPVPRLVVDALDSVQVTTSAGSRSGFQMSFKFSSKSELNTIFLIVAGQSASLGVPPLRVLLIVTLNGTPQTLFDGVMTNVEVQPGQGGSKGTITVTGEDLTRVMDMLDFSGLPYPAMPIAALPLHTKPVMMIQSTAMLSCGLPTPPLAIPAHAVVSQASSAKSAPAVLIQPRWSTTNVPAAPRRRNA